MSTCVCLTSERGSQWTCAYRVRSNRLCGCSCFGLAAYDDSNSFSRMWPAGYFQKPLEGRMNQWMDAGLDEGMKSGQKK